MKKKTFTRLQHKIIYCKWKNIKHIRLYEALSKISSLNISLEQSKVICFEGIILFIFQRKDDNS